MARREFGWSGTAAEPNRKCANLRMCVDFWDTPVQMCLQRRAFQSALLRRSQTFLLDLISEMLESTPLQIRPLDISLQPVIPPTASKTNRHQSLDVEFTSGSSTVQPQAITAGRHCNQQLGFLAKGGLITDSERTTPLFTNHWQAHNSNL